MNIVHLTDLHFASLDANLYRQSKIIGQMVEDISLTSKKIDFLFFTGDLVDSGNSTEIFQKAKLEILDKITNNFNISVDRVFICPGNHDVNRKFVSNAVIEHIDKIRDNNSLDKFCNKENVDYASSLRPLDNYFKFVQTEFAQKNLEDIYNENYSCHIRHIDGINIGIACINTAWRAVGMNDTGNLVLPLKAIKEALQRIKNTEFKILIHHHPLADFKG